METRSSVQQAISGYFYRPNTAINPEESSSRSASTSSSAIEQTVRDSVILSQEGKEQSSRTDSSQSATVSDSAEGEGKVQLDPQEIKQLQKLKRRDQEVRTHEQAHLSAAGRYARGGISLSYQKGPDGVAYAVGGEVGIDLGEESTPEATLLKMQTVKRAALAPANPSGADRQIAAQAAAKEARARQEILRENQEEILKGITHTPPEGNGSAPIPNSTEAQEKPILSYAYLKSAIAAYKRSAES